MSHFDDNGKVVSLHRDLAEANGQLREMKTTMAEILKAMGEFRLAIEALKSWQSAMVVESRVDKSEIKDLQETVEILTDQVRDMRTTIRTLQWAGTAVATILGLLSANRDWILGK